MLVLGAGVLPRTLRDEKSVCVSSVEAGPRSWVRGLGDAWGEMGEVENLRDVGVSRCLGLGEENREIQWERGCGVEKRKCERSWIVGRVRAGRIGDIFMGQLSE